MKVGKNFSRQGGCWIDVSFPYLIEFGDDVGLSRNVTILAHDNSLSRLCGLLKVGGVKIGSNVFIGANTTILPNTKIGNNVVIGAGSVVNGVIPDNSVACGVPARIICSTTDYVSKYKKRVSDENLLDNDNMMFQPNQQTISKMKKLSLNGFFYMKTSYYKKFNNE